eukprot:1190336-Prorocentrum_minimum.AAC.1
MEVSSPFESQNDKQLSQRRRRDGTDLRGRTVRHRNVRRLEPTRDRQCRPQAETLRVRVRENGLQRARRLSRRFRSHQTLPSRELLQRVHFRSLRAPVDGGNHRPVARTSHRVDDGVLLLPRPLQPHSEGPPEEAERRYKLGRVPVPAVGLSVAAVRPRGRDPVAVVAVPVAEVALPVAEVAAHARAPRGGLAAAWAAGGSRRRACAGGEQRATPKKQKYHISL